MALCAGEEVVRFQSGLRTDPAPPVPSVGSCARVSGAWVRWMRKRRACRERQARRDAGEAQGWKPDQEFLSQP